MFDLFSAFCACAGKGFMPFLIQCSTYFLKWLCHFLRKGIKPFPAPYILLDGMRESISAVKRSFPKEQQCRNFIFLHSLSEAETNENRQSTDDRSQQILLHVRRADRLVNTPYLFHYVLQQHALQTIYRQRIAAHLGKSVFPFAGNGSAYQHHQRDTQYRPSQASDKLRRQLQRIMEEHIIGENYWLLPWYKQKDNERGD